ncbi:uncharacterized protein DUF3613 [Variovorax sp. 54]|uniref:DUF3613 domain-containing protein n=1 Tax=Variovorax sp. 54 TaxID=2035212 RepID=UPI000C199CB5|nr:DUF3613 domain-containing protein [Variovorax sp. 54]PIF74956.1 uncharacterized protein DUF3613 [Variovorax sp. 54]
MSPFSSKSRVLCQRLCIAAALVGFGSPGLAQSSGTGSAPIQPESSSPLVPPENPADPTELQVGDATQSLMYWQRTAAIASPTPRPIPGPIAYRSYERYLKSFEHPIPEHFNSTVKTKTGN